AEKFPADVPDVLHADFRNRMAGPLQRLHGLALRRIGLPIQLQIGEEPVAAVAFGHGERLAGERDQPASLLACAFREELLQPRAEIGDPWRGDDRHLVASEAGCRDTHGDAELHAWIFRRWDIGAAGPLHRPRRLEQASHVKAQGRSRHQAELRQHGVASADRWRAIKDTSKLELARSPFQRGTGIGHRNELLAGLSLSSHRTGAVEEVIEEYVGLERTAGL